MIDSYGRTVDDMDGLLTWMAGRFERYVDEYETYSQMGEDKLAQDRKYSAYELGRVMDRVDPRVGKKAVEYLRDNGL